MVRRLDTSADIVLDRAFCVFVSPFSDAYNEDGSEQWVVHIVGHGIDNMTQGTDAVDAVEMAADLLGLISGRCPKAPDRRHEMSIDGKSFKQYMLGCQELDEMADVPAYGCKHCEMTAAPDQCIEEIDLSGVNTVI